MFEIAKAESTNSQEKLTVIVILFGLSNGTSFFKLLTYSHVHILFGSFLPSAPYSPLSPLPRHFQAEPVLSLSLILLKKRHKPNKEDKVFLLVELRIAIQKYS
jgi:hypothetical protein